MSIFDIFKKKGSDMVKLNAAISALVKNEIVMGVNKNGKVAGAGSCKIGGKPYLPSDFAWPTYRCKDDGVTRPLSFLCQINLSEIKVFDRDGVLPASGMLYFFYECEASRWGFDPEDKGAARVFYFENTEGFSPIDVPSDISEDYVMPEIAVKFTAKNSYPWYEEFEFYDDLECDWDDYDKVLAKLGVNVDKDEFDHKMLGYADIIQNEMLTECERSARGLNSGDSESYQNTPDDVEKDIAKQAAEWTLLLQLGTISLGDFEWMFGDCGMIYFYIKKEDLAAKRFENAWFSVQCG